LSRLLDLDLVLGELRRSQRARGCGCGQKVHPLFERLMPRDSATSLHSTRWLLWDARFAGLTRGQEPRLHRVMREPALSLSLQEPERQGQGILASKTV
jgi:hypothetical protein